MAGALELDLCIPHKNRGRLVRATHTVNGEAMCRDCFRGQAIDVAAGAPIAALASKPGGKIMKRKIIDWEQVQRDRDEGAPVSELEKKYGVSNPTIYTHTHAPKNGRARARQNERTNERTNEFLVRRPERMEVALTACSRNFVLAVQSSMELSARSRN